MNILEEQKKSPKGSKILKYIIFITVIFLLMIIGLIIYVGTVNETTLKVVIDGKRINNLPEDTFIIEGNNVKIKIKDLAPFLGEYSYRNGQYGRTSQYTEDKNSCYLQSNNEVVTYTQGSKIIEKVVLSEGKSNNTEQNKDLKYEEYDIKDVVEMINNNLYTNLDGISIGCNVQIAYDKESNSINIFTLENLVNFATEKVKRANISGEDVIFSNKKAVLYGLVVVQDEQKNYGVNSLNNEVIIGEKYASIKFIESTKEFIVKTLENKMGIISITKDNQSKTKISPAYDSIEQIDEELYLVSNNNKYGIINKNNQIIVNVEYEEIGLNMNMLAKYDMKNAYIIYDECIPVKKDKLWGIINKTTRSFIIEPTYDDIGCIIGTSSENSARNVILVPEYEGIIVKKDEKYGMINSSGKIIIQPGPTEFYLTTTEGKNNYYFVYNGESINLIDFLKQNNIQPIKDMVNKEKNEATSVNNTSVNNTSVNNIAENSQEETN